VKRALGIEIGRSFVALCEIRLGGGGTLRRQRHGRHDFGEHQTPIADEVADACLRLAFELGVRQRQAVLVLARALTYEKPIELPPLPTEDRLRLVMLQPERFFPISDRALVCDLESSSNGLAPVAHAADAERVEALVEALQSRGFRISAVLPASAALLRAATRAAPELTQSNWLLVRPEGTDITAYAFQSRDLRVSRRIENFAAEPAAALREITRTAACSFDQGTAVDQVRWSGWRELPEGLREIASSVLPLPVRDFPGLPVGDGALAAYGAALASLEEAPRPDLLPPSVRARRRQQSRWVTAACAGLGLLGVLALLWSLGERQESRLRRLDAAIAQVQADAEEAAEARDSAQTLEGRIASLQADMDERAAWMRLLNEVSTALPSGAWIANLSIDQGGEVSLSGYAATASSLVPALEETQPLKAVEFATAATRAAVGDRELEAFNIRAVLAESSADSARAAGRRAAPGPTDELGETEAAEMQDLGL
jgi:Tfp pilus assembly protein PilN